MHPAVAGASKPRYDFVAKPLPRRHYARLIKEWAGPVGIEDIAAFSTYSLLAVFQ